MKKTMLLGVALLLCLPMMAQTNAEDNEFWGSSDSYLQRQTARALDLVNQALQEYPPMVGNVTPRRLALSNLDAILHNTIFDKCEPLMQFVSTRILQVIAGLQAPLSSDMAIFKLYNDGFIVRTQSATVAFDMVMGSNYQYIPDQLMAQLVDQCDILFLSHNHDDHVDPRVVKLFTDRGKQVVAPDEALPNNQAIMHFRKEQVSDLTLRLPKATLQVKVLPGHQDELQNNIYVVTTPEGLTFAQTGDQYLKEDIPWIKQLPSQIPELDVLLINCWAMELQTHVAAFRPKLVITGHENEMGHSIDHREAYWMSYLKLDQLPYNYSLMTWGECYQYNK
jgi:L-ascorbate metabolism protein UlaG (beta-lactamase superfamily)